MNPNVSFKKFTVLNDHIQEGHLPDFSIKHIKILQGQVMNDILEENMLLFVKQARKSYSDSWGKELKFEQGLT